MPSVFKYHRSDYESLTFFENEAIKTAISLVGIPIEEILHKRIVHINGSVYVNNIYSLNGHLESVYVNNIYTLNGHLTRKSVYVNNIYTLNWHLTRKSVYAESPLVTIN